MPVKTGTAGFPEMFVNTACSFYRVPEQGSFIAQKKASIRGVILWQKPYSSRQRQKNRYTLYLPNHTASHSILSWSSDMSVYKISIFQQHTNDIYLHACRWNPWLRRVFFITAWHMAWRRRGVTCEGSSGSTCPSEAANCTSNHSTKRQYSSTWTSTSKPAKPSPG